MSSVDPLAPRGPGAAPRGLRSVLPGRRQLSVVVVIAFVCATLLLAVARNTYFELLGETLFVGMSLLFAFTVVGAWRRPFMPRWVAQVVAIVIASFCAPMVVQMVSMGGDFHAFLASPPHVHGYWMVAFGAAILGTVTALAALYLESDEQARGQALHFALEREKLERQAADARLNLMTAQIQPHFLLNTLANVQELVESGSPRAAPVFRSLIDYLRAALPQLRQGDATLADEEKLVRAYLELMHMRMPDRLSFSVEIDPSIRRVRFPAMALLTLVENAIRHGIDPGVEGGRVEVAAQVAADGGIHLWVADTGVGMSEHSDRGMGLSNLDARLEAFFGAGVRAELSEQQPHGVRADIRVPASFAKARA